MGASTRTRTRSANLCSSALPGTRCRRRIPRVSRAAASTGPPTSRPARLSSRPSASTCLHLGTAPSSSAARAFHTAGRPPRSRSPRPRRRPSFPLARLVGETMRRTTRRSTTCSPMQTTSCSAKRSVWRLRSATASSSATGVARSGRESSGRVPTWRVSSASEPCTRRTPSRFCPEAVALLRLHLQATQPRCLRSGSLGARDSASCEQARRQW
mmetsp:Transcript_112531/g.363436  ORF Transcript_112531/g.363436 Transcript_112531/m.363436 type:complete len:213 (-) Transcript_112531:128-766(-)